MTVIFVEWLLTSTRIRRGFFSSTSEKDSICVFFHQLFKNVNMLYILDSLHVIRTGLQLKTHTHLKIQEYLLLYHSNSI